jgi:3-hydroxyacyl-[acyl-carrier-protein] dehydratase
MAADEETRALILSTVPQQYPFRFIDEILQLDEECITGAYRFRRDEFFYAGHFPGRPITPGVILIETMAQTGVVAFGLYLTVLQKKMPLAEVKEMVTLFTLAEQVEFAGLVKPEERVVIRGEKVYFRRGNLKARVTMERENGEAVCSGVLAGMGISRKGTF